MWILIKSPPAQTVNKLRGFAAVRNAFCPTVLFLFPLQFVNCFFMKSKVEYLLFVKFVQHTSCKVEVVYFHVAYIGHPNRSTLPPPFFAKEEVLYICIFLACFCIFVYLLLVICTMVHIAYIGHPNCSAPRGNKSTHQIASGWR